MKNIQSMTRHQAERAVQDLNNGEELIQAMEHKNRHVQRASFRRGMLVCWGASFFGMLAEILPRPVTTEAQLFDNAVTAATEETEPVGTHTISKEQMEQMSHGFDAHLQASYKALAEQYGESVGYVETIAQEKNGDLAAVKRSLISRRSAKTRAANKNKTVSA